MYYSIYILLLTVINFILSSHSNPGHLKPFGTVGSLINIEEINKEYPNILKLFQYYIPKLEPIISRQVLTNDNYYKIWKTDEQLEKEVDGLTKTNIYVQSLEKHEQIQMKFGDFIDKYEKEHLAFADNVPEILRKYFVVPQPLQCDSVLPILQSAILVINGIYKSPLMFNEEYDSLHCLFRGNKRIVLVNTNKYPNVRQMFNSKNFQSQFNPEKVDLNQFPELQSIDYHIANLTAGDCLFIPINWILYEDSLDKTLSVIYNLHHKQALNIDLNEIETCSISNTFDSSFTLDQIDWSMIENESQNLKDIMMNLINSDSNNFEEWQKKFSKSLSFDLSSDPETSSIFTEFYDIIDVNGNGQITTDEIEQINGMHQHHISDILYEMVNLVTDKQKKNLPKQSYTKDEHLNEELKDLDDEDMDEHLHLQNYKTDL